MEFGTVVAATIFGILGVYVVARLIFAAYFRSKADFHRRFFDGSFGQKDGQRGKR